MIFDIRRQSFHLPISPCTPLQLQHGYPSKSRTRKDALNKLASAAGAYLPGNAPLKRRIPTIFPSYPHNPQTPTIHTTFTLTPLPRPFKASKKWNPPNMNPLLHSGNKGIVRRFNFWDLVGGLGTGDIVNAVPRGQKRSSNSAGSPPDKGFRPWH